MIEPCVNARHRIVGVPVPGINAAPGAIHGEAPLMPVFWVLPQGDLQYLDL
jgi:hypothetical protein